MKTKPKKDIHVARQTTLVRIDSCLYKKMRMISLVDEKSLGSLVERALNKTFKKRLDKIDDMKIAGL